MKILITEFTGLGNLILSASIFETLVEDKVKNRNTYNFPAYKQMLKFFNDKSL